jgi:CheY-like chemotaxis protein
MTTAHALIIDDNRGNVDVLMDLLKTQGVTCTSLSSPRQLEQTLQQLETLDVIFLDLEMPNYNGFEVLAWLQADQRFGAVPVVAYTVHTSEINEAREAGFHSFLGKPLKPQAFPDHLRRILSGEPVWDF